LATLYVILLAVASVGRWTLDIVRLDLGIEIFADYLYPHFATLHDVPFDHGVETNNCGHRHDSRRILLHR